MSQNSKIQTPEAVAADRRQFFKMAGLGAVAVGTGVVGAATPVAAASEISADAAGYSETPHVKTYYALAK